MGGIEQTINALTSERDEAEARAERLQGERDELAKLLREAWDFPDQPGPADGEMADEEVWKDKEAWRSRCEALDERIRAALDQATEGEE